MSSTAPTLKEGSRDDIEQAYKHLLAIVNGYVQTQATKDIDDLIERTDASIELTLQKVQKQMDPSNPVDLQVNELARHHRKVAALKSLKKFATLIEEVEW